MPATLSTLTEWAKDFTHGIFETSDTEWLAFFDKKVSPDAQITANGHTLTAPQLKALWTRAREKYVTQTIDWQRISELPKDPEAPAKGGLVAGFYVNSGLYRNPENPELLAFNIRRTPHIYIESQDPNSDEDTRRLVRLTIVSIETAVAKI